MTHTPDYAGGGCTPFTEALDCCDVWQPRVGDAGGAWVDAGDAGLECKAASGASITITGNQTLVTLNPDDQVPISFQLPKVCDQISRMTGEYPNDVFNVAELQPCSALVGKTCLMPNNNSQIVANDGTGGAVTCKKKNGDIGTAYCVFGNIYGVVGPIGGTWSMTPAPALIDIECNNILGKLCHYDALDAVNDAARIMGSSCLNGKPNRSTDPFWCTKVGNEHKYCVFRDGALKCTVFTPPPSP